MNAGARLLRLIAIACLIVLGPRVGAQTYTFFSGAVLYATTGLAVDPAGNVYTCGFYGHTIFKISPNGSVSVVAGTSGSSGSRDGQVAVALFNNPRALALDSGGNVYVADMSNHVIRKITPAGLVTTLAGTAGQRGSGDGTGAAARFDTPQGIAVDASGNVYVADYASSTIRKITPAGTVSTLAGAAYAHGSVDGTQGEARFDHPSSVVVDASGVLFVADTLNHTIRRISATGATTTLAGSGTQRGFLDATGAAARFDSPQALAIDAAGNLFVADTNNYVLRQVSPAGQVITLAGTPGFPGDSIGTASATRFLLPRGVAVSPNGTIHVADTASLKTGTPSGQLAITVAPRSQAVAGGSSTQLSVTATGAAPISYQWHKDGIALSGATRAGLAVTNVQPSSGGTYAVTVSNAVGSVTSASATLTIVAPVPNDNFADAFTLTGSAGSLAGNNTGATDEPGEPTHDTSVGTTGSIWYRWTPTETGTVNFEFRYSSNWILTAAYTGSSLTSLTRIAVSRGSRLSFQATAGTTYRIAVASSASSTVRGNVTASWQTTLNDALANAQVIAGNSGQVAGNNTGATGEPGEPVHWSGSSASSTSVWYRWTPTTTATAVLRVISPEFQSVLAVYAGSTLAELDHRATSISASGVTLVVTAGVPLSIAVGSNGYGSGNFTLTWTTTTLPVIPFGFGGGTVIAGGSATFDAGAVSAFPVTVQWSRNGVPIPGATNFSLRLTAVQPADSGTYSLVATNQFGTASAIAGTLTVVVPPANDNFANAQVISGPSGTAAGNNATATGETGEPAHWNLAGTATSVWYRWTPASSGLAVVDTVGSTFDTILAVYTGSTLGGLTRLVQDDDRGGGRTSQVSFLVSAGTTYFIAVGGNSITSRGPLTLNWQLSPNLAIATAPASQIVPIGGSATFTVSASGSGVTYQWSRNGVAIPGATTATLTVAGVQAGSDATYTVTITNSNGTVTSAPATLSVVAPNLTNLTVRHARIGGTMLWGLAGDGATLVAVGGAGAILSSHDNGRTWTPRISGTSGWIVGVTHGAGQFVAVAEGGLILTSPDGITWTPARSSGTTQRLNNVIYAEEKFVVVGEAGTILTSTDAQVWTPRTSGVTTWLHGLAYNPAIRQFAATGADGVLLYSADAVTWNRLTVAGLTAHVEAIAAVNSYADFVAIGHDGLAISIRQNQLVLKSGETLITWSGEIRPTGTTTDFVGLAAGADALFAMGTAGRIITATSDRGPWYTLPAVTPEILLGALFHNDTLYIVGANETIIQSDRLYSSRLINISTRGQVGTGGNLMISGFVLTGDQPKQVLVRAAGPTLAASFGLTGTLAAPVLTLVDSQNRTVATNAGWNAGGGATAIAAAAARVGAFPFAANSADSALLATLAPGAYTALIAGAGNTTGLSIVEVYDTDALSNQGARAINISTRGVAGSDQNKLIAGFVIDGASARRVLIRAVGPGISGPPFNVAGTLAEPQIELYTSRNLLHATAGAWGLQANADEIRGAARTVSAFALPDGSRDSAMVVTLLPGAWTVQVGGPANTSGVVLVEVYALP